MRSVTIRAPKGHAQQIAELAFRSGISQLSIYEAQSFRANGAGSPQDVIELETATPKAKRFIEALTEAPFYNPSAYSFSLLQPESLFASEAPEAEAHPIIRPTTDVYLELWQFTKITSSLLARVFFSALLLAYGMHEDYLPLIIAGLLFLPYHHHLLGLALGGSIGEGRFLRQGLYTFLLSTLLLLAAGMCVGLLTQPPQLFSLPQASPLTSFLLAVVIGIAAGFAAIDDAGRRELIGLAATAHISIYPVWFGLELIYGLDAADKPVEKLLVFLMNVATLTLFAALVLRLMKMRGSGIRRFAKRKRQNPLM